METKLTFLGTGTSQGIPIIGCGCDRCRSADPRDKRYRSSVFVEYGGLRILVDVGPDFRSQMLRAGIGHLDAILLTHNHKDHTGGLDDVRSLNYTGRRAVEIYCEAKVLRSLQAEYSYAFAEEKYPGAPEWHIHLIDERPFVLYPETEPRELVWVHDVGYRYRLADGTLTGTGELLGEAERVEDPSFSGLMRGMRGDGVEIIPIRGYHHDMPVLGFRFGGIAYITDMSRLPDEELVKLRGLEHLTLNTVGYRPHHSHFSLDEALTLADRIGARHTWLTHLSHNFPPYQAFCEDLRRLCAERGIRSDVLPAHDGLILSAGQ